MKRKACGKGTVRLKLLRHMTQSSRTHFYCFCVPPSLASQCGEGWNPKYLEWSHLQLPFGKMVSLSDWTALQHTHQSPNVAPALVVLFILDDQLLMQEWRLSLGGRAGCLYYSTPRVNWGMVCYHSFPFWVFQTSWERLAQDKLHIQIPPPRLYAFLFKLPCFHK